MIYSTSRFMCYWNPYIFSPKDMDKSGYSSIAHNSPKLETTQTSISKWMDKQIEIFLQWIYSTTKRKKLFNANAHSIMDVFQKCCFDQKKPDDLQDSILCGFRIGGTLLWSRKSESKCFGLYMGQEGTFRGNENVLYFD